MYRDLRTLSSGRSIAIDRKSNADQLAGERKRLQLSQLDTGLYSSRQVVLTHQPIHWLENHACAGANIATDNRVIGDEDFVNTAYAVMTEMFDFETDAQLDDGNVPPYTTPLTLDDGKLACYDIQDPDAHPEWFYDVAGLENAAVNLCEQVTLAGLNWSPVDAAVDPNSEPRYWFENPDMSSSFPTQITTGMIWIFGNTSCPTLDLRSEGALEMCKDRLNTIIHNCKLASLSIR